MADEGSIDLMGGGFTRGMLAELEAKMLLQVFSKYISSVDGKVNDGKEATVYLCCSKLEGIDYLAAKVYRDRRFRGFANNAEYADTGRIRDRRLSKAVRKGSKIGRKVSQRLWVEREWQALTLLRGAGVSVPRPYDHAADAILMEFIGGDGAAAPMLAQVKLDLESARRAYGAILQDVELLLANGLVHGDLSAYNVLYQEGRPRVIDLPQVVELDAATDAWTLFYRDLENIGSYFIRRGVQIDPLQDALRLWSQYVA